MTNWPEFDASGDLPVGVYEATLSDVVDHFGSRTPKRRALARRLARIYKLAASTGYLARFIVFGSFVTSKDEPNDVDIFMLENTFDAGQLEGEASIIFEHLSAQNYEGASIFWIRRLAVLTRTGVNCGLAREA